MDDSHCKNFKKNLFLEKETFQRFLQKIEVPQTHFQKEKRSNKKKSKRKQAKKKLILDKLFNHQS